MRLVIVGRQPPRARRHARMRERHSRIFPCHSTSHCSLDTPEQHASACRCTTAG